MLVKTSCVYKYWVHFESPGLKTVLRKFKVFELPWKDNNYYAPLSSISDP